MKTLLAALALAALAPIATTVSSFAQVAYPRAGVYAAGIYIASTNGSFDCLDSSGWQLTGLMYYNGMKGTKASIHIPLAKGLLSIQKLTVTAGAGTEQPSGAFTWIGSGILGGGWSNSGTFSAWIYPLDADDFQAEIVETYGNCTETDDINLVRGGTQK